MAKNAKVQELSDRVDRLEETVSLLRKRLDDQADDVDAGPPAKPAKNLPMQANKR